MCQSYTNALYPRNAKKKKKKICEIFEKFSMKKKKKRN